MSSTLTMSIQHCPDEVLDMIFELLPVQSPDRAPAILLATILTCSRFYAVAKRYLTRVVCLQTALGVNLFAAYLTQLIDTGAYGTALLPIAHMAVFGPYRISREYISQNESDASDAEKAAERILPFIISIAAPSLRSLTVFGFDSQVGEVDGQLVKVSVKPSVCFPKLQSLILLEQYIFTLDYREEQSECSLPHRYPQLTSLYTHGLHVSNNVLALDTLRELRLDMLNTWVSGLPSPPTPHVETIIIDCLPDQRRSVRGCFRRRNRRFAYQTKIENYRAFINANSSSPDSSVVKAEGTRVRPEFVLDVWKDIVQGGSGCWKWGLEPTTGGVEEF